MICLKTDIFLPKYLLCVQLYVVMYAYVISREGVIVRGLSSSGVNAQLGDCPAIAVTRKGMLN
jgi:hypothetical protein